MTSAICACTRAVINAFWRVQREQFCARVWLLVQSACVKPVIQQFKTGPSWSILGFCVGWMYMIICCQCNQLLPTPYCRCMLWDALFNVKKRHLFFIAVCVRKSAWLQRAHKSSAWFSAQARERQEFERDSLVARVARSSSFTENKHKDAFYICAINVGALQQTICVFHKQLCLTPLTAHKLVCTMTYNMV